MRIINKQKINKRRVVNWGNGLSFRILKRSDGLPYGFTHTTVFKGTESRLQYINHIEACYCIAGLGQVQVGGKKYKIYPGIMYIPESSKHILRADKDIDLELVCVFNPPLIGNEKHKLSKNGYSTYEKSK